MESFEGTWLHAQIFTLLYPAILGCQMVESCSPPLPSSLVLAERSEPISFSHRIGDIWASKLEIADYKLVKLALCTGSRQSHYELQREIHRA